MLGKLLKYDLEWCFRPLLVFYALGVFFSLLVRIVESFEQNFILLIIDKLCCGAVIAILISILINCFMRNWARFVANIYKDESYLTHTLPVTKNEIYLSKVLAASITLLTSFVVIIGCIAIAILDKESWMFLKTYLEQSAVFFDSSVFSLVCVLLITVFFETLFMLMSGILGIVVGHRSNNLKIVKSIIAGFIVYMALSSLSVGALFVVGLVNTDLMSLFTNVNVSSTVLKYMMLVVILVYIMYNLGIYFIGNKLLNKGVNVD